MIKFFRKIRQKLLSENPTAGRAGKFSKYLIYAIGEIVLVVIGILIALQINTWQRESMDRREETSLLLRFKSDLQEDSLTISRMTKLSQEWGSDLENLLQGISERNLNAENFAKYNSKMGFYGRYEKIKGTYKEAIGAGKFDIIRNKKLKSEILRFYERTDYGADEVMYEQMNGYITPTFFKIVVPSKEAAFAVTNTVYKLEPINLDQIYQNREYHSIVIAKLGLIQLQEQQWEDQKRRIELLVNLIDEELNKQL